MLPNASAASFTDLILSDHNGVAVTVSPANAPPAAQGFGQCLLPLFPDLPPKAQIQTLLQANPVTTTLDAQPDGISSNWKFKMLQGVIAPHSMLSVQGNSERSGYDPVRLERPMWQLQAVIMPWMSCAIRQQLFFFLFFFFCGGSQGNSPPSVR